MSLLIRCRDPLAQPSLSEIFSPALWYDASDSSTVTLSGSTVSTWANKGATSGYNLSLSSGTPTYTATQNGFNVMTYAGTARMTTTQLGSVTHIFVASAWSAAGAVSTNYNGFLSSNSYDWHGDNSANLVSNIYAADWVKSQPTQSTSQLDGSNFVNNTDDKWTTFSIYSINLQSGYTGGFNGTGYGNGSDRIFIGNYGEILVYQNTYLTTDQINIITGYLAWKWGSQSLLPASHPYKSRSAFYDDTKINIYISFKSKNLTPTTIAKFKVSSKFSLPLYYEKISYTASNNLTVTNNGTNTVNIFKTSGSDGWDNHAYSNLSFTAPCTIEFNKQAGSSDNGVSYAMIAWNEDPTTNTSYTSLDHASYPYQTNAYSVYNNGSAVSPSSSLLWSTSEKFYLVYNTDGTIKHYNGSTLLHSVSYGTGKTVYVDSSFYSVNGTYGGFSNIRVIKRAWNGTAYD